MESSFTLKVSELDSDFVKTIKKLFKKDREISITISSATDFDLNIVETKEEYFARLEKALKNLEGGGGVSMSEKELDKNFMEMIQK